MPISRRGLVVGATAAALSAALSQWTRAAPERMNPLKIPPLLEGAAGADKLFDLDIAEGHSAFLRGVSTPTFGINGPYLGPTIRVHAGDRVTMRVRNGLSEPTALHWHGLHVPARCDGGPHQVIEPGSVWQPSFEIKQKASACWYHGHLNEKTGEHVLRGLAGLFLIDDDETRALGLPSDYGVDDVPLIIQDRRFDADGNFEYITNIGDVELGYMGDVILVNGTASPYIELRRQRTRLRVLNASNARIYNLGRSDGIDLVVIGSDGGLLEHPARMRHLRLGPGERVELLLDIEPNQRVTLMSFPAAARPARMMMHGMAVSNETFPIIELRTGRLEPAADAMPDQLVHIPAWNPRDAARTRRFTLDMSTMSIGSMIGPVMEGSMGINGRSMDMERIDERVPLGSVEIWEIRNTTPLTHPFHVHDIQFRVLDRDGAPPEPHEQGLKDTVLVDAGSTVRVIAEFADFADPDHPYMYHCHILEHEDAGMMGQFVVV